MTLIKIESDDDCTQNPIELGRAYWAAGAGLFTSQKIEIPTSDHGRKNINIIYDCGTSNPQKIIQREIDEYINTLNPEENVDILIVSHIDKDHISGIEYLADQLKDNNKSIKRIYYPFLQPSDTLELAAKPSNYHFIKAILDPFSFFREYAELAIPVGSIEREEGQATNLLPPGIPPNTTTITVWEIKMNLLSRYSKKETPFLKTLSKSLNNIPIGDLIDKIKDPNFRKDLLKNDFHKLKNAYTQQSGLSNLNNTSICAYSGPPEDKLSTHRTFRSAYSLLTCTTKPPRGNWDPLPGWLGTGDAPLKSDRSISDLQNIFLPYLNYIESVTVPHHGSNNNWNPKIKDLFQPGIYWYAGANKKYGHPSQKVVDDITNSSQVFNNMTADPLTRFSESYSIRL